MAEFTNRCFNYAQLERGPVQLNIPRDHFYGDVTVTTTTTSSTTTTTPTSSSSSTTFSSSSSSTAGDGGAQVRIPAPMETERSGGGPAAIAEAADLLAQAKVNPS